MAISASLKCQRSEFVVTQTTPDSDVRNKLA